MCKNAESAYIATSINLLPFVDLSEAECKQCVVCMVGYQCYYYCSSFVPLQNICSPIRLLRSSGKPSLQLANEASWPAHCMSPETQQQLMSRKEAWSILVYQHKALRHM